MFLNRSVLRFFVCFPCADVSIFIRLSVIVCAWDGTVMGGREQQAKALGWNVDNAEQRAAEKSTLTETSGLHGEKKKNVHAWI